MLIKKEQKPILAINIIAIIIFTIIFMIRKDYEFTIYVGVIIAFLVLILSTNHKVDYPQIVLWGLTIWSILHMSGGGIFFAGGITQINISGIGTKLYEVILLNLVGEPYMILRYDQFIHVFGFGVATLAMYYILKPLLKEKITQWVSLSIIVIMAGFGVGAFNEFLEFIVMVIVPETGVGGYVNTSLDLVADLIGAIAAMTIILIKEKK